MEKETNHVNLLWTGGWDSTFQLLQLLLIYKCEVTPFYMIHEERPSTCKEIRVMKQIKESLLEKYLFTKELLHPIQYTAVGDIPPNAKISTAYQSILKKNHVGSQYEWLARFCQSNGIKEIHLSIQEHIKVDPNHFNVQPWLKKTIIAGQKNFILDTKFKKIEEYQIFRYFAFPLMKLTKLKMNEVVNKNGWGNIMDLTWFCHTPTRSERPCGVCIPCTIVIEESFAWRIPIDRRIFSFFYRKIWCPFKWAIRAGLIRIGMYSEKKKI